MTSEILLLKIGFFKIIFFFKSYIALKYFLYNFVLVYIYFIRLEFNYPKVGKNINNN